AQDTRDELEQLKRRVEELEKKAPAPARSGTGTNAFNPDISIILQGTAARSSQNPDNFQITGFAPSGGEVAPPRRGFSLGESELFITSNIDPYFRGQLVASLTPEDTLAVEEAFFQTLALGRSFPASDPNRNSVGQWNLFGHVGGDVGESTAWRAGLSYLRTSPRERAFEDNANQLAFSGRSALWIADFVAKWAPAGNASITNVKLQGEYFRRTENGDLTFNSTPGDYASRQSGWYTQAAYQFMPRWRVGYRYDRLSHGTVSNGLGLTAANAPLLLSDYNPSRNPVMAD